MRQKPWLVPFLALALAASALALAGCGSEPGASRETTTETRAAATVRFPSRIERPPPQPGIESLSDCAQLQAVFDQADENYKAHATFYKEAAKQRMREIGC